MTQLTRRMTLILSAIALLPGCGESVSPEVLAARQRFLSQTALTGERPIPEIQNAIKAGELDDQTSFVVRARINAGDFSPFGDGLASFMITDATGHDGDESHNPHECPFCKRDINSQMARVEFCDDNGKPIAIDSRTLLDVREFDLVLIKGTGRFEDDSLIVTASQMFVRR